MQHIQFVLWIALFAWAAWYISAQLDRLNGKEFAKTVAAIQEASRSSRGALRIFGVIMYSPYLAPISSALTWMTIVASLFFLKEY